MMRDFLDSVIEHYVMFWTEVLPFGVAVMLILFTFLAFGGLIAFVVNLWL